MQYFLNMKGEDYTSVFLSRVGDEDTDWGRR
jgi:hypothetical protein